MTRSSVEYAEDGLGRLAVAGTLAAAMRCQITHTRPNERKIMAEQDNSKLQTGISKIPGTDISSQWVWVTPERAKAYLEYNVENRSRREKHLMKLVDDIENDRYRIHHQGIAFDDEGIMIDGQHRCIAIMRTKIPQWILVSEGFSKEAKKVVDMGAKRNAADFLPGKNKGNKQAAIKLLLALKMGDYTFTQGSLKSDLALITSADIQDHWDTWNDLDELVVSARKASLNVPGAGPAALAVAAVLYPETGKEFLDGLAEMQGLKKDDPRLALLKYRTAHNTQTAAATFISVKAAKAFAEGRKMGLLRLHGAEQMKVYPLKPVED